MDSDRPEFMNAEHPLTSRHACKRPALVWFRDDLRTGDNPALSAAVAAGGPVAGLYVLEAAERDGPRPLGAAARWKLHGALAALAADLAALDIPLLLVRGDAMAAVRTTAERIGADKAFWNRRYAPGAVALDRDIKASLRAAGLDVRSGAASLLVEPWELQTGAGGAYKVFTPFCRAARNLAKSLDPLPAPDAAAPWPEPPVSAEALDDWALRPTSPDWADGLRETWAHGEAAATDRLQTFVEGALADYASARDRPGADGVSMLSPHLRFGEIGPRQARAAALAAAGRGTAFEAFERELYWRDFCASQLFHADDLARDNIQTRFDAFPWRDAPAELAAWRRGKTGYPIVDAGMRQLWHTGWMHNRVRMIAASFLTKHLLIDWRVGERWFWDTLVDADAANNPANWQWVAGSGADAAPYFRIFNPMTQGETFDADGAYVRRWIPELARLPDTYLHAPWKAPAKVLAEAGVTLGEAYPEPIVDHKAARARALAAYKSTKDD